MGFGGRDLTSDFYQFGIPISLYTIDGALL